MLTEAGKQGGNALPFRDDFVIAPELPIIDAHHHLWILTANQVDLMCRNPTVAGRALAPMFANKARYLLDEYLADIDSGHDIRATVFVDSHAMYRRSGPHELRTIGEVEFANGVAAIAASGAVTDIFVCAAIVGGLDLCAGNAVEGVLSAHIRAGGDRYRGVRMMATHDDDVSIQGSGTTPGLYADPRFRLGFSRLADFNLSFEAAIFHPQLNDLVELARAFPEIPIALNHLGTPLGIGRYQGRQEETFAAWKQGLMMLAKCDNVFIKLGGLAMPFGGLEYDRQPHETCSSTLSSVWRPYIAEAIEMFGAERSMFESNFPVDSRICDYRTLWNAFKLCIDEASAEEKRWLLHDTAHRFYRLRL